MSKAKRIVAPFTNKFGDTINPGDKVYAITTCTHRTRVNESEYVGYVERSGYDFKTKQKVMMPYVQVKTKRSRPTYYDNVKKATFKWSDYTSEYFKQNVTRGEEDFYAISTLYYNNIVPRSVGTEQLVKAL